MLKILPHLEKIVSLDCKIEGDLGQEALRLSKCFLVPLTGEIHETISGV